MSDFSVLKCYQLNINYSVNILNKCLRILIDCSQLSKTYYVFGSSTLDRHAWRIYRRTFSVGGKSLVKPMKWQKTCNYTELFGSSARDRHARRRRWHSENNINASCMTISDGRTEQLDIFCGITGFTEWFSQFHSCGTYSVLSRSHSVGGDVSLAKMTLPIEYAQYLTSVLLSSDASPCHYACAVQQWCHHMTHTHRFNGYFSRWTWVSWLPP